MAEGSVNLTVSPERTVPNEGDLRRNSMGKASSSNRGESIPPHYLRASTGSCHDFCKYGRKHAFEAKARRPILKRVVKKAPKSGNPAVSVDLPGRKEIRVVERKPSSDSKSLASDTPQAIKQELSTKSPDNQHPAESEVPAERKKKLGVKFKSSPSSKTHTFVIPKTMKREGSSAEKIEVSGGKRSTKIQDLNLTTKHHTSLKPKPLAVKPVSSPRSSKPKALMTKPVSSPTSSKPKALMTKPVSSPTFLKPKVSSSAPLKPKPLTVKPVSSPASLTPRALTVKPVSSPKSPGGTSGFRNSDVKIGKTTTGTSKGSVKKALAPPVPSLSLRSSANRVPNLDGRKLRDLKVVPPHMNKNKTRKAEPTQSNSDEVQEKTLYVIEMQTENKPLESDRNQSCVIEPLESAQNESCAIELSSTLSSSPRSSSLPNAGSYSSYEEEYLEECEFSVSEADDDSPSENKETNNTEEADMEEGYEGRPRKAGGVCPEDKDGQSLTLKFRRGKVVDNESVTDSPRRLKFRRGKVLGENQNVKSIARRRTFKKTGVDGNTNGNDPGAQKVVLRHQDVQGKKEAQCLFNLVIEETASKLVEARTSKVKALVGAFETVISLQEKKPSSNAVT
ncbi:hypothetical protein CJ030_MR6G013233 [Morella rubra]|uniref:Calmodulin-binding domain-containing protein n=1 Tax=Morella rubra TaxID=262757 RepID=A0A6A1VFJ1_9ROSI|nr:hypothetical protein CJ030_MR6G013233 [Morella rubra]